MKQKPYTKFFDSEDRAHDWCGLKNNACRNAGNLRDIYALIDGPNDNFAVVDLPTAIDFGQGYEVVG